MAARPASLRAGSGPPVLLISGLGGAASAWMPVMERLRNRFDCLGFDHGVDRDALPGDPRGVVPAIARQALAAMDAAGWSRAHIAGQSLGGAAAQWLAVHAPDRVDRLALIATWAAPTPHFVSLFALRRHVLDVAGPEAYLRLGQALGHPGWWLCANHDAAEAALAARLEAFAGTGIERQRLAGVVAHDLKALLPRIVAPTLVLSARDDAITPAPMAQALADAIPGARLELLPEGGHFALTVVPGRVAGQLAAHLGGIR